MNTKTQSYELRNEKLTYERSFVFVNTPTGLFGLVWYPIEGNPTVAPNYVRTQTKAYKYILKLSYVGGISNSEFFMISLSNIKDFAWWNHLHMRELENSAI